MIVPEYQGHLDIFDVGFETWEPRSLEDVYQSISLEIEADGYGAIFFVTVATPEALRARQERPAEYSPYFTGHHLIIVLQWNWPEIRAYLQALIAACAGETREEVGVKLSRYFEWEYGYRYPASFPYTKPGNSLLSGYLHPELEHAEYKHRTVW